ncbi:MAG: virulence protein SciE type [Burkholderiales bacterium]|nr:virulence protein SciE type [Burkholderiales bacterium]
MSAAISAERSLLDGDPVGALKQLQDEIRAKPGDAKLRVFLFQLLCVLGEWERALNQLDVAAKLDPIALAMAQTYREAIRCESLRAQVFEGKKSPMVFGQPEQWLALLIEGLLVAGQGRRKEGNELRVRAFDEASASSGKIDGQPFAWIADADSRLGPICEAIINGRYYWVPFSRLTRVAMEAPADLRDFVWMPAHFQFENGGESVALIPSRYPGSEKSEDGQIALGRKTVWDEAMPDVYHGFGQRLLATDNGEIPLMDIREIVFDAASPLQVAAEPV